MAVLGTIVAVAWIGVLVYALGDGFGLWFRLRNWRYYLKKPERRGFDVLPPKERDRTE